MRVAKAENERTYYGLVVRCARVIPKILRHQRLGWQAVSGSKTLVHA